MLDKETHELSIHGEHGWWDSEKFRGLLQDNEPGIVSVRELTEAIVGNLKILLDRNVTLGLSSLVSQFLNASGKTSVELGTEFVQVKCQTLAEMFFITVGLQSLIEIAAEMEFTQVNIENLPTESRTRERFLQNPVDVEKLYQEKLKSVIESN